MLAGEAEDLRRFSIGVYEQSEIEASEAALCVYKRVMAVYLVS